MIDVEVGDITTMEDAICVLRRLEQLEVEARAACKKLTNLSQVAVESQPTPTGLRLVLAAIELACKNLNNSRRYLYEQHKPEFTYKFDQHFSSMEPHGIKDAIISVLHDNNITVGGQDWRGLNGTPTGIRTEIGTEHSTDLIVYNDHSELRLSPGCLYSNLEGETYSFVSWFVAGLVKEFDIGCITVTVHSAANDKTSFIPLREFVENVQHHKDCHCLRSEWVCPITSAHRAVIEAIRSNSELMQVLGDRQLPCAPNVTQNHAELMERSDELAAHSHALLAVTDWTPNEGLPKSVRDFLRWETYD